MKEIQEESQEALDTVTKTKEDYRKYYQEWKKHWEMCITSQGDYFEGVKKALLKYL